MMQDSEELQELEELRGVDLALIDLSAIDLEKPNKGNVWLRILGRLSAAIAFGFLVWLPQSEYFRFHKENNGLFFAICIGAIGLGSLLGRWLWLWLEERAKNATAKPRVQRKEPEIPNIVIRILMLLSAVGIIIWILFVLPGQGSFNSGHGYSQNWFMALIGAVAVALLLSRWLIYQGQRPKKPVTRAAPIQLPPWFKWVSLSFIAGLALLTAFGAKLFNRSSSMDVEFGLGSLGLVVGIAAAIWIGRRFDEAEARYKARTREKNL
ncbi:MAG: hypothetical protein CMH60_06015 [Myxococcales bacterium]|nr:hypothetical protein [Myxococcales bacterium]|tara:strand:- start:607 stop:1404 length:798 start_codon:yes stop_codon:yes gene_type:complete